MNISIQHDLEGVIQALVSSGAYPSADAVVDAALRLLRDHEEKLQALRETVDASIARGGANTDADAAAAVADALGAWEASQKAA